MQVPGLPSAAGDVGIGTTSPALKLEVAGSVRITGEVNQPATSTANMLPIAYGNISAGAAVITGSFNVSASKIATGWYAITIAGESYQFQTYTTLVTPVGGSPIITSTGSGGGVLYVYTFNASGVATDSQFCFTVFKL